MRRPPRGAGTREHRGEHRGRHVGEVEHDRRPELHVGLQHPVRATLTQLGQRSLLQGVRHLIPRGAQPSAGVAQHASPGVFGPVDPVTEAHEPLTPVEHVLDVFPGVAGLLDAFEHVQHPRRGTAVQRPAHRADGTREARSDVGAGGGDDPGREGRGVHAVLSGRDPIGVDGLDVQRVGLAAPADHEPLDDRLGLVDLPLRHHRAVQSARGLPDEGQRHDGGTREILAGLGLVDVQQRAETPDRGQLRDRRLHVDPHVAGVHGQRERLRRRQPRLEGVVHEQAPHLAERHPVDEVFDVNAAIAQRAAFPVGLGDLGLEGDHSLQSRFETAGDRGGERLGGHQSPVGGLVGAWRDCAAPRVCRMRTSRERHTARRSLTGAAQDSGRPRRSTARARPVVRSPAVASRSRAVGRSSGRCRRVRSARSTSRSSGASAPGWALTGVSPL